MMVSNRPIVVVSPFANEKVRAWPLRHYRELIEIVLREGDEHVVIVGARMHRAAGNVLVRGLSSQRVTNACGDTSWGELGTIIDAARYVVANNSGVAHYAASRGCWTLCLFSASHAYVEWRPRGPRVVTLVKETPCSPCVLGTDLCPNGFRCMTNLRPAEVFQWFKQVRENAGPPSEISGSDRSESG